MSMENDNEDGLENELVETSPSLSVAANEVNQLKQELAKAQAENAQLREAALLSHKTRDQVVKGAGKVLEDYAALKAENARLRDLLRQTEEMLRSSPHRPIIAVLGLKYHCIPIDETETQAARLRAAREGKP